MAEPLCHCGKIIPDVRDLRYAPLVFWTCDACGSAGELSLPLSSYGCDAYDQACKAHAQSSELCEGTVRVRTLGEGR